MTIRRSVTLYQLLTGESITKLAWIEELVALCTSFLLAVGIIWIAPVFQSIQATNSALERSIRAQRALSSSNQIIIHTSAESDETTLMQKVCEVIAKIAGYRMVWIGMVRQNAEKSIYPAAQCGFNEGFLEQMKFTWGEKETDKGPTGTAIRTGETTIVKEIEKGPRFHPWWKKVNEQDYHATIAIPLRIEDEIIGALVIYSSDVDAFDEEEVSLLTELAADLSYSINILRMQKQKIESEERLFETQQRVKEIFQRSPVGVIEWSKDLEVEIWNPAAEKIFGYTRDEAIGKHVSFILNESSDVNIIDELEKAIKNEGEFHITNENITKDGDTIVCEWYNFPLYDQEEQLICVASLVDDDTDRVRSEEAREEQLQRLQALRRIDASILGSLDLKMILNTVIEECIGKFGIDAVSIYKYDQPMGILEYLSGKGFNLASWEQIQLKPSEGLAGQIFLKRKPLQIDDVASIERESTRFDQLQNENFISYIGFPLISRGEIKGILEVFTRSFFSEQENWLDYLQMLAGQAAIAIENVDQFEKLQRLNINLASAYDKTIEGWSRTLELRDEETEGHTLRVTEMTLRLAEELGVDKEDLIQIRRGALLHDIGKMGIPDSILRKPGALTDNEWELMKQHPKIAYDLLTPIKYLRPALNIPYFHHEKWDGSGYPNKLAGEQIPLEARIFAVIDVWDALCSDRPYRKAWSEEKAIAYIKEQTGKHFDPKVVDIFLELVEDHKL